MNKSAVLHIPLSQYAFAENEHAITVRIRTQRNDLKKCELYYGDRVYPTEPIAVKKLEMKKISTDDLFDFYEVQIEDVYTRICYYFLLDDGIEKQYYYGRYFCTEINCNRTEYFQFPYIRREDIIDIPKWAEDIVMYHIFPDSFASEKHKIDYQEKVVELSDNCKSAVKVGGTLQGVRDNIDYIKELGINCIYLNPIFSANSYHKYDTIDYFDIDPCLGNKEIFRNLVKTCHDNGIRVILDGVFNHCGPDFFAFKDVLKKGKKSSYYDWFYYMPEPVEFIDPPQYEAFAYVKEMPKLNTGNPQVIQFLCSVGTYWIKEADIDGWRLDVANEINHDFWRIFRKEVRKVKSDAFFIGEIWEEAGCWLLGDQFDSTMNYTFSYLCKDFFAERTMKVKQFDEQIHKMLMRYPRRVSLAQMNFLDSHDIPRFLYYCKDDKKKMELAFFYLFMSAGIPSVFYGDECQISGNTEPCYREPMRWQSIEDKQMSVTKFKKWIAIRHKYKSLRRGDYKTVLVDEDSNCYAFIRTWKEEQVLVVINNSTDTKTFNLEQKIQGRLLDAITGKLASEQITIAQMEGRTFEIIK